MGCFKDKKSRRTLPVLLVNDRDPGSKKYDGHRINWHAWEESMLRYICLLLIISWYYLKLGKPLYFLNRPFPSSLEPLFQSESKCESFVMVISSAFHMNENSFSFQRLRTWNRGSSELGNGCIYSLKWWLYPKTAESIKFSFNEMFLDEFYSFNVCLQYRTLGRSTMQDSAWKLKKSDSNWPKLQSPLFPALHLLEQIIIMKTYDI